MGVHFCLFVTLCLSVLFPFCLSFIPRLGERCWHMAVTCRWAALLLVSRAAAMALRSDALLKLVQSEVCRHRE